MPQLHFPGRNAPVLEPALEHFLGCLINLEWKFSFGP